MSGMEAVAHALAGSTGGIVAMALLYPLENIRARLQVQVKRRESTQEQAAEQALAQTPLVHTHALPGAPTPLPDECISPETPHLSIRTAAPSAAQPQKSAFVPLNTPRRALPAPATPAEQTCLACLAERNPSAVAAAAAAASPAQPAAANSETRVLPSGEIQYQFKGSLDVVRQVCAREGPLQLYSGLSSALMGVGCSSACYFYCYYLLKSLVLRYNGSRNLGPLANIGVASVSGVINVLVTLPIWLVNTRMTVGPSAGAQKYTSIWDAIVRIHKEEGIQGFYRGILPSIILVSNPAIQFVVYDQCIRLLTKQAAQAAAKAAATAAGAATAATAASTAAGVAAAASAAVAPAKLSSLHFFLLGAFSKAAATLATYPYQVVKSRQQASRQPDSASTTALVKRIWREEGLPAFFNGMTAKMSQTVLNSALMFLIYERLVAVILRFLKWMSVEFKRLPAPAP